MRITNQVENNKKKRKKLQKERESTTDGYGNEGGKKEGRGADREVKRKIATQANGDDADNTHTATLMVTLTVEITYRKGHGEYDRPWRRRRSGEGVYGWMVKWKEKGKEMEGGKLGGLWKKMLGRN